MYIWKTAHERWKVLERMSTLVSWRNRLIDFTSIWHIVHSSHAHSYERTLTQCRTVWSVDFSSSQLRTVSLTHIRQHAHIFTCMQKNSCISISKMVCLSMGSSILPDYYCKWNDCTLKPQNNVAAQKRATKQTKWAQSAINDVYLWITYARAFLVVAFFRPFAIRMKRFEWFYGETNCMLFVFTD